MIRFARFTLSIVMLGFALYAAPAASDPGEDSARQAVTAFLKAIATKNVDAILKTTGVPFLTDGLVLLKTRDQVRKYLSEEIASAPANEMADSILGVMSYEKSRGVTDPRMLKERDKVLKTGDYLVGIGRNQVSRGLLLVRVRGGSAAVVGIGI